MNLSEIKTVLPTLQVVDFVLEDGTKVPKHFHVTEIGMINKHYIDCGGTIRNEKTISFQLWSANDFDHRLKPQKLLDIITLSEEKLGIENSEIEVEYQAETIGKFDLDFDGETFILRNKQTDCLAKDKCGIPTEKPKVKLADLQTANQCNPNSGCC